MQPEAPKPKLEWTPEALDMLMEDFDMRSMDVAPSADPKSVTDMQRMMRAQFLMSFLGQPGINNQEIQRRQFEAANIEDIDKLFVEGPDPMAQMEAETKQLENEKLKAEVKTEKAKATETMNKAENVRQEAKGKAFERGVTQGSMAGGVGGVEGAADDEGPGQNAGFEDGPGGDGMGGASGPPFGS
jgi:hypothetical protein